MYLLLAQHRHICKEPFDPLYLLALHESISYPLLCRRQGELTAILLQDKLELFPVFIQIFHIKYHSLGARRVNLPRCAVDLRLHWSHRAFSRRRAGA